MKIANNGLEAIEALKKQNFDLVLMDVQMPIMDGIEATRIIRNSKGAGFNPEIPVIALTSHAMGKVKQICLEAGMNAFMTKPLDKKEFIKIVNLLIPVREEKTRSAAGGKQ